MKRLLLLLISLGLSTGVYAQQDSLLTLEQALSNGLKNNFDILISRNQAAIAEAGNTLGQAGMLPRLNADAAYNRSVQTINQEFATGQTQNRPNAQTRTAQAGVQLDWTVFDGFRMFATSDRLKALSEAARLELRAQVETAAADIVTTYLDLVRQQQQLRVTEESIRISLVRVDLARTKYEIGSSSKLDYLQAQVDLNADSSNLLQQLAQLRKGKQDLNFRMGLNNGGVNYRVADTLELRPVLALGELQSQVLTQNLQLQAAQKNQEAVGATIRQAQGLMYPSITLTSRYNISDQTSQAGLVLLNNSRGLNYGATARWSIFDGGNIRQQVEIARLQATNINLGVDQLKASLNAELNKSYEDYLSGLAVVRLVQSNLQFAAQSLDIATERYKLGKINLIEFRQAQLTYIDMRNRLLTAVYNAKRAESQLLLYTGRLSTEMK